MKQYLVITECAIEYAGRFLVIERPTGVHGAGLLAFPGGKVEAIDEIHTNDILREAAKREVLEEVGIALHEPLHYVTTSYFYTSRAQVLNTIFHCRLQIEPVVIPNPREVPNYFWLTAAEIYQATNAPEWLKGYVKMIR